MRSFRLSRFWSAGLLLILLLFAPQRAEAVVYYVEFGGGIARGLHLKNLDGAFPENGMSSGYAAPLTLGINLQTRQSGLLFQLALQSRYVGGTSGSESVAILSTTPVFRIELWRLVLGVGYTPWVWEGTFSGKYQVSSLLYEAQFLFPITPEIDFGLQGAMQTLSPKSGGSSATTIDYGAFFRLNFGMSSSQSQERRKYKGWRYPLGVPLK